MVSGLFGYKGSFTTSTLGFNDFSLSWMPVVDSNHVRRRRTKRKRESNSQPDYTVVTMHF
jgi:hypothetical protein